MLSLSTSRPCSVPYSMKGLLEEKEDTIEPIPFSEWAAPIVPVLKSDKKLVRICGDFKVTINSPSWLKLYPIPKVDELFAELPGGQAFTKLVLSQAYQQINSVRNQKICWDQHQ